jgi:hypothetical protein
MYIVVFLAIQQFTAIDQRAEPINDPFLGTAGRQALAGSQFLLAAMSGTLGEADIPQWPRQGTDTGKPWPSASGQ